MATARSLPAGYDAAMLDAVLIAESLATFKAFLSQRGLTVDGLNWTTAIDTMLDFYLQVRAEDAGTDQGDMLLFQWSVTEDPDGRSQASYYITRQLIKAGSCEDEDFRQLNLCLTFQLDAPPDVAQGGSRWCDRPEDVEELRAFIRDNPATALVAGRTPRMASLGLDEV